MFKAKVSSIAPANHSRGDGPPQTIGSASTPATTRVQDVASGSSSSISWSSCLPLGALFKPRAHRDSTPTQATLPPSAPPLSCGICFDTKDSNREVVKTACGHAYCKGCLREHLRATLTAEVLRQATCPTPQCERVIEKSEARQLLSAGDFATFVQRRQSLDELKRGAEPDEDMRAMMRTYASKHNLVVWECGKCHAFIEKKRNRNGQIGCDKMTCRCGNKFCFKCGAQNANCSCTSSRHDFIDHGWVLRNYGDAQRARRR